MNQALKSLALFMILSLASACAADGSGDEPSNQTPGPQDTFGLADLVSSDVSGAVDSSTPEPDLVDESETDSMAKGGACQLTLRAEARDLDGPCTTCTFGDYITLVGVVENTCESTLTYSSDVECLVSEFVVLNLFHESKSEYPMTCKQIPLNEVLATGEVLTKTRPAGTLSAGDYKLTVQFEDAARTKAELLFSVQ